MFQFMLAILSLIAVWLSLHQDTKFRKYAPVFGLAAQPFWLISTIQCAQWGMFALSVAYTIIWAKAYYDFWIKPSQYHEKVYNFFFGESK